jgi:protein O-GlcNAc transferase
VFGDRLPSMADHLARHRLADLFLDTLPYNAHTTASDALWAGLFGIGQTVLWPFILSLALALRITKVTIEIEKWARD